MIKSRYIQGQIHLHKFSAGPGALPTLMPQGIWRRVPDHHNFSCFDITSPKCLLASVSDLIALLVVKSSLWYHPSPLSSCHYLPPCRLSGILVEQLARVLLSSLLSPSIQKALNIHPAGASFGTNSQSAPGPANTLKQIQVQFPHWIEKSPALYSSIDSMDP